MTLQEELVSLLHKEIKDAADSELYEACLEIVRQRSEQIPTVQGTKKVYYISAEFLTGKQLGKNLINLGLFDEMDRILKDNGKSLESVEAIEKEPSLGNGGLGRLAACFLDSIATLNLPGDGVGLRYLVRRGRVVRVRPADCRAWILAGCPTGPNRDPAPRGPRR